MFSFFEKRKWEKVYQGFFTFANNISGDSEHLLILERDQLGNERAWRIKDEDREQYDVDYLKAVVKRIEKIDL